MDLPLPEMPTFLDGMELSTPTNMIPLASYSSPRLPRFTVAILTVSIIVMELAPYSDNTPGSTGAVAFPCPKHSNMMVLPNGPGHQIGHEPLDFNSYQDLSNGQGTFPLVFGQDALNFQGPFPFNSDQAGPSSHGLPILDADQSGLNGHNSRVVNSNQGDHNSQGPVVTNPYQADPKGKGPLAFSSEQTIPDSQGFHQPTLIRLGQVFKIKSSVFSPYLKPPFLTAQAYGDQ